MSYASEWLIGRLDSLRQNERHKSLILDYKMDNLVKWASVSNWHFRRRRGAYLNDIGVRNFIPSRAPSISVSGLET